MEKLNMISPSQWGGVEQKGVGWRVEVDSTGEGGTAEKQEDQSAPIVSSTSPTPIVVQTGSPVW